MKIKNSIKSSINDMLSIWKAEFEIIFKDSGVVIFFILVPLVYPLIYGFIYTNEVMREVPVAVVDHSSSTLSREYLRNIDGTPDVHIVKHCADMEEAKRCLASKEVHGIIYIPRDFTQQLMKGEQTQVSLFCDMSGLLFYKAILIANTSVSQEMNKKIKISRTTNYTERDEQLLTTPISYQDVAMFNSSTGFASFLIPAVLILLIQQTLTLGIGLSAGTQREKLQFNQLTPYKRHPNGLLHIVLGKSLSYFMIYAILSVYVLCAVPRIFKLNQIAQPDTLILFVLPYLFACIFFAMTLSILVRNRETSMLIFVFTSIPLLFISGISWPGTAIPPFWKYISYLFPSTFGINGFVKINNMGAYLEEVSFEYKALWIQTIFYFFTTCLVYERFIRKNRQTRITHYKEWRRRKELGLRSTSEFKRSLNL